MNKRLFTEKKHPLVYIKDAVIFPDIIVELFFSARKTIEAVKAATASDNRLIVVTEKNGKDEVMTDDLYRVGVVGRIIEVEPYGEKQKVLFDAEARVLLLKVTDNADGFSAVFEEIVDDDYQDNKVLALKNHLFAQAEELISLGKVTSLEVVGKILSINEPNRLINNFIPLLDDHTAKKQEILEAREIKERLMLANHLAAEAIKIAKLEKEVAEKTSEELSRSQKEVLLREEMKTIQKELGEEGISEYEDLKNKIDASNMPPDIYRIALKELKHLEKTPAFSPEISFIRNYLDWLVNMPWSNTDDTRIDIADAERILNEDHYGLSKVKKRVLEFLAVKMLTGKVKSQILCFTGPPGTGKTSIGKSIARALGRKFFRISLGGVRDEAEIRGHRRTYVGAMPGRIIQGVRQVKSKNPVFMLDEVDKLGADFRGDPSAALLEALDPEQNFSFSDHYLEVPFDLSEVLFITTANVIDNIPPALRDRMEVIDFPGYTDDEKYHIATSYIWPKIVKSNGLMAENIEIEEKALKKVISEYTQEAGVRNLERELSKIVRQLALSVARQDQFDRQICEEDIEKFLGSAKKENWTKEITNSIGVVAAMAVTEAGGEILSIEASSIPGGKGNLILTGHLGEVMRESAQAALSYARTIVSRYGFDPNKIYDQDIHIHVPLGAVPKDGPSAGAAIATAIISAILQKKIDAEIAMTGEITLRGRVMRIGGVKEKILAAKRAGLKTLILPKSNAGDVDEVLSEYKNGVKIVLANSMDEILPNIFDLKV